IYLADSSLDYDRVHQIVEDNTYDSIGDAVISKISDAVHNSEWYQHTPQNFDLVHNFKEVQAICGDIDNMVCYMDSLNWSIMNKTELTADIFRFISHRMSVIRTGFTENFLPSDHIEHLLNFIDWHFILDCICWFF
ncbi:hypothetical protein V7139_27800, partial [Neobacillus drentensis]|uniref:hypothetical protein n=1 Tax=Neobacillus drentensis TaxID=220684 RepID=UPI00300243A2